MVQATVGNYKIIRPLGQGGMGVVYEAEHQSMGRRAAIKVLHPELIQNRDTIVRFFNEARATNEVRHPGIVQIYDCGTMENGAPWLIMELLEGETLTARLARVGRLSPADTVELGSQTASVLAAAHAAGIIHRDLKPDNLFVVPDPDVPGGERVKVLDFGIAKLGSTGGGALATNTKTGVLMGTPIYMSPEQCRGTKQVDARSDIYSLGLILYQMLAGEPPFLSDGIGELFDFHMNVQPAPLAERNPAVNVTLAQTIHKALMKSPADRHQTMGELQRALATAAADPSRQGAATAPVPVSGFSGTKVMPTWPTTLSSSVVAIERPTTPPRRSRVPLVLGGGAVVLGATVALTLALRGGAQPPRGDNAPAPATLIAPPPVSAPVVPETPPPAVEIMAPHELPGAETVTLELDTAPTGARVVDVSTGETFGMTPFRRVLPRGAGALRLRVEKKGFVSKSMVVPPGPEFRRSLKLDKVAAGATPTAPMGEEKIIKL